jgi:hypothetical protein
VASGEVVIERGPTDEEGNLEPPDAGEVVLSVPSPETLPREAEEIRALLARAGTGVEPLVVVIEAAEELREEELAPLIEGAGHTARALIVRVIRNA